MSSIDGYRPKPPAGVTPPLGGASARPPLAALPATAAAGKGAARAPATPADAASLSPAAANRRMRPLPPLDLAALAAQLPES